MNKCIISDNAEGTASRLAHKLGLEPVSASNLLVDMFSSQANTAIVADGSQALLSIHSIVSAHRIVHMLSPEQPRLSIYLVQESDLVADVKEATKSKERFGTHANPRARRQNAIKQIDLGDSDVADVARYFGLAPKEDGTTNQQPVFEDEDDYNIDDEYEHIPHLHPGALSPIAWILPANVAEYFSQSDIYGVQESAGEFLVSRVTATANDLVVESQETL